MLAGRWGRCQDAARRGIGGRGVRGRAEGLAGSLTRPGFPRPRPRSLPVRAETPSASTSAGLSWTRPGRRQQVLSSDRFPFTVPGSWQVRGCVSGTVGTEALAWPQQSLHVSMVHLAMFFFHSFIYSLTHSPLRDTLGTNSCCSRRVTLGSAHTEWVPRLRRAFRAAHQGKLTRRDRVSQGLRRPIHAAGPGT